MKINTLLKYAALIGVSYGFLSGCSTTTETPPEAKVAEPATTPVKEAAPQVEATPVSAPAPTAAMKKYQVERGDSLWAISAKAEIYDNPYQWPLIYKANSDKIRDADLIYPGQQFDIDSNPTAAETNAAIRHARTRGSWSLGVVEASDRKYLGK